MLVCKDAVFGETIASLENKYQKIISLVGFINDEPIDATKAQETFEALRIKKHYLFSRNVSSKAMSGGRDVAE